MTGRFDCGGTERFHGADDGGGSLVGLVVRRRFALATTRLRLRVVSVVRYVRSFVTRI